MLWLTSQLIQNLLMNIKILISEEVYNTLSSKYKLGRVRILLKKPRTIIKLA